MVELDFASGFLTDYDAPSIRFSYVLNKAPQSPRAHPEAAARGPTPFTRIPSCAHATGCDSPQNPGLRAIFTQVDARTGARALALEWPLTVHRSVATVVGFNMLSRQDTAAQGLVYAVGAYLLWGLFPIYWKQLSAVPAPELLAHRVAWSFVFVAFLVRTSSGFGPVRAAWANPKARRAMLLSTTLISLNWGLFIWSVNDGRIMEASLGYYINPLFNVLVGRFVLQERLTRWQIIAVIAAAIGVANLAIAQGSLPWVSLTLAASFSVYGLVRKQAPVEARTGLFIETGLATPVALGFLLWLWMSPSTGGPSLSATELVLLVGSGAATAIPLMWFAEGARRLRYSTLGIVQYIAPTCQLGCAVLIYDEAFTRAHAVTFAFIWSAVLMYALDALWRGRPAQTPALAR